MFSDTAMAVKIPSKSENIFIIGKDHISPFRKEPALCSRRRKRTRKWEARVREKGDAVLSCSVTFS